MIKLRVFSVVMGMLCLCPMYVFAGNCLTILCDYKYRTTEMLTEDGITGGPRDHTDGRFSSKRCYMCDTGGPNGCNFGDTVVIAGRTPYDHRAWQCTNTSGTYDTWSAINDNNICVCGDSPLEQMTGYIDGAGTYEIRDGDCRRGSVSNRISQNERYTSLCRYRACLSGYTAKSGNRCVQSTSQPSTGVGSGTTPQPTPVTPSPTPAPNPTQNCINSRTSAEGKACCLVPSSVAKWNGEHCICTDTSKTFINGACVSQQQSTTVTFSCSTPDMNQLYAWLEQYASNAQIVALINQILEFCTNDDNRSQTEFKKMMAELRALIAQTQANIAQTECKLIPEANWVNGKCVCIVAGKVLNEAGTACVDSAETVASNLNAALQKSRNEISSASRKISSIKESFKKTVWKNEDGDFNTTRLASDSIAAVVLGTAGGLITSNVIKKNQVANGFEDINCTVGGQKVAGWGDQFRVGIQ